MTTVNSKEHSIELYKNIISNSEGLMEEATILFENKRYKRAFFLSYTSLEEIEKLKIHLEKGISFENLTKHNAKGKIAQQLYTDIRDSIDVQASIDKFKLGPIDTRRKPKAIKSVLEKIQSKAEVSIAELVKKYPELESKAKNPLKLARIEELRSELIELMNVGNISQMRDTSLYISGRIGEKINPVVHSNLYKHFKIKRNEVLSELYIVFPTLKP